MKCKDCKYLTVTKEFHNGDKDNIQEYMHCSFICKDEYEMENVIECDGYKKATKPDKQLRANIKKELSHGKKPRKQPDGSAWKKKDIVMIGGV